MDHGGWHVDSYSHPIDIHVLPLGDWREHFPARDCWCHPEEMVEDEQVVYHRALDDRERYEQGAPLH